MNILRLNEVSQKIGLGRTAIYALIKENDFPTQIKLSARASGWLEDEVDEWINIRAMNR